MEQEDKLLTSAEWNLMECLWEASPRTGREAAEYMAKSVGWSRSTTLTMLRRMSEKGLIACREQGGMHVYAPLVNREEAAQRETDSFLSRIYRGSVSSMVNAITSKQKLSKAEIADLYDIIRRAEEETT